MHSHPFVKQVLEKYLKKSAKSSSTLLHHSIYPTGSYSNSSTLKGMQHTYSTTSGMPHLIRPSGFSPYYVPPPPPPSSQAQSHHMVKAENTHHGGSITVQLTSCLTDLDLTICSLAKQSKQNKQEVSCTVRLPFTKLFSIIWLRVTKNHNCSSVTSSFK